MRDFPTLSYAPQFVKYLKPEKGTPFGWNLPVKAIIGSTPLPLANNILTYCWGEKCCCIHNDIHKIFLTDDKLSLCFLDFQPLLK